MSERALTGKRLSTKEFMNYLWLQEEPSAVDWEKEKNDYQWGAQTLAGAGYLWSDGYYDFAGYEMDDLTVFPERITVQESGSFRMNEDIGSDKTGAIILDMITEERITDVSGVVDEIVTRELSPSFCFGPLEYQQVIFGRYRMLGHDNAIWTTTQGNLSLLNETQFGSGSPSTAQKLWVTRIIIPLGTYTTADLYILVPAARYIISYTVDKEPDLEYMMRLKRSYEVST